VRIRHGVITTLLSWVFVPQVVSAQPGSLRAEGARLEEAACPFEREAWAEDENFECHYLIVPQDREESAPTIRLPVVILRARRSTGQPPVVMLHGGPGLSALRTMLEGVARADLARDRDVVLYDQRGAGLSEPPLCPEFSLPSMFGDPATDRERLREQARRCIQWLHDRQIDPAAYNSIASADDLHDLRLALGYESWVLYGESYGGRLAQEAMRRDPRGIHAVVLSSPTIIGPGRAEAAMWTQHALERVFAACEASPRCNSAFPRVAEGFRALYDDLQSAPLFFDADSAEEGDGIPLDGARMVELVRRMMRTPANIAFIPLVLHELQGPHRIRAARELVRRGGRSGTPPIALFLVDCYDQYGPEYDAILESTLARVAPAFRHPSDLECDLWQERFAPDDSREAVRSEIPTLIVTGEFDPVAPPEWGRRIASTLSRSYVYEIPTESHGARGAPCRASIISQFLADPSRQPDASCIAALPPIEFETDGLGRSGRLTEER
jgi:pimeloyl-ACP methyl ester carboxylesterase